MARDPERAAEAFRRGCRAGDGHACARFGLQLRRGHGVRADDAAAREAFARGCDLGDGNACALAALDAEQDAPERAATLYDRGCRACDGMACANRAALHLTGRVAGDSASRGVAMLESTCLRMGSAAACGMLAKVLETGRHVAADPARAKLLAARACQGGFPPACPRP